MGQDGWDLPTAIDIFDIVVVIVRSEIVVDVTLIVEEGLDRVKWDSIVVHEIVMIVLTCLSLGHTFPGKSVEEECVLPVGLRPTVV